MILSLIVWLSASSVMVFAINMALTIRRKRSNFRSHGQRGIQCPPIKNIIMGHLDSYIHKVNEFEWHRRFGKVFGFYSCDEPDLKVADLRLIQDIFIKQNKLFNTRLWNTYRLTILKKSILFNKGEKWRQTRRLIQPALNEYRIKTNDREETIQDLAGGLERIIGHFRALVGADGDEIDHSAPEMEQMFLEKGFSAVRCSDSPTGWSVLINTYEIMQIITLDVIYKLAFNLDTIDVIQGSAEPQLRQVKQVIAAADGFAYKLALAVPFLRPLLVFYMIFLDNDLQTYRDFIRPIVSHNIERAKRRATLKQEAEASQSGSVDSQPTRIANYIFDEFQAGRMTKGEATANTFAILVAGFETTATTASYALWCLAKHQQCREKLEVDIQNYGLDSKYLDMFIKEVMRMYPALPNFVIRSPHEDATVGDLRVCRGQSIHVSVLTLHYDPTIWEDPYNFNPDRFAEGKIYPVGAYAPFGLGHRMCAGFQLALREMKTIICALLSNFRVHLVAPLELETVARSIFLTKSDSQIRLKLVPITMASNESSPGSNLHPDEAGRLEQNKVDKSENSNHRDERAVDPAPSDLAAAQLLEL